MVPRLRSYAPKASRKRQEGAFRLAPALTNDGVEPTRFNYKGLDLRDRAGVYFTRQRVKGRKKGRGDEVVNDKHASRSRNHAT